MSSNQDYEHDPFTAIKNATLGSRKPESPSFHRAQRRRSWLRATLHRSTGAAQPRTVEPLPDCGRRQGSFHGVDGVTWEGAH